MKKVLALIAFCLVLAVAAAVVGWSMKTQIAAHFIGKQLHVPAEVGSFDLSSTRASLRELWIGNPPGSRTKTSFTARDVTIDSTWGQLRGDPLVIDEIDLDTIFVGVEFYNRDGKDNNWSRMLSKEAKESKGSQRGYLIKTLVLSNLTVQVTQADGSTKRYPTIAHMEFHNISSETGLPLDQIEKAIFQLVLKELFQKLDLNQVLDTINAIKGGAPIRLPKLF